VDLDVLEEALDRLTKSGQATHGEIDSIERIERLERLFARVEAYVTQQVADFDASGVWAPSGARSAGAFLTHQCHLPGAEARRQVRRGRQLRHLPCFEAAWSRGHITAQHVDVIASVRRPGTEAALERHESMLVEQAERLQFAEFVRVVRYWEQHADPDGAEEDAMEAAARRDVFLTASFDGMWLGTMTLDPIPGSIVSGELGRLEQELFAADWAKAKDELGRDPGVDELCRTSSQRRADALVEMATRSKSMPADGRRPEPLFSVLVGYEELGGRICELANGVVLTPGSLLPWLEEADMERAVFAPGRRVEVSITSRFFTGATRRAIELRDRVCQHPYCDMPVERCQIDHIIEFSQGGLTTQENGRLLCAYHNGLRNQRPPPRE
jgi:hypothetical protein